MNYKKLLAITLLGASTLTIQACSTNQATGRSQFTGLMSPQQENSIGAEEHEKVVAEFGLYNDAKLAAYVNEVGRSVTANTERADVQYKFYLLDSPVVNAFALPGGYIYLTRGLLALSNNEAEMAAVLGHEAGHITGRHSAERYSRGVVTSLGASVLAAAVDKGGVSQLLGLGSQLYLSSYSRSQENEADTLGIRYLSNANYDAAAMTGFLQNMQNWGALEDRLNNRKNTANSYFSTHPPTSERVTKTSQEVAQVSTPGKRNENRFLDMVDGMTYGDSAKQGFVQNNIFMHPELGFKFDVPQNFRVINQPSQVVVTSQQGAIMIYDMQANQSGQDSMTYLRQVWLKGENVSDAESITINGMRGATASFQGNINNQAMTVRLIAIEFAPNRFARFQIGIPNGTDAATVDALKRASYSFAKLSASEKAAVKPNVLRVVTAKSGDSVQSLAAKFPYSNLNVERFRVLNGLNPNQQVQAGQRYKIVVKG